MKRVLIATEELDPHADPILIRLRQLGHEPIRLHTADIPLDAGFSLSLGRSLFSGMLRTSKVNIPIEDIGAVWWRRPKPSNAPAGLSKQEALFQQGEVRHAMSGFWAALDCYWMSSPDKIQQAGWKPEQLKRAANLGFDTPRTIITTSPTEVRAFLEECDRKVIYKVMSDPSLGLATMTQVAQPVTATPREPTRCTYATLLSDDIIDQHLDKITVTPSMFQEYVPKRVELRVTIIGDDIFVAEIDSQAQERTQIDWRHYDVPMKFRRGTIPDSIAQKCFNFVKSYGLNFSAMDIIVTPDDRYVFIENNPNGQWLFVESLIPELKMSDALISCLLKGAGSG